MRRTFAIAMMAAGVVSCGGGDGSNSASGSIRVSRADFGERWPFTIETGLLTCFPDGNIIFLGEMSNGGRKFFSLNRPGYDDFPGPASILATNGNVEPLIERAKPLCEHGRTAGASGAAARGTFRVLTSRDPMTDIVTTTVMTQSVTGPETLAWSCANGALSVGFNIRRFVGSGDKIVVTYRFPPDPPETSFWSRAVADGYTAVLRWERARTFTDIARKSKTVILRANDTRQIITAEFSLEGVDAAVKQLPCDGRK